MDSNNSSTHRLEGSRVCLLKDTDGYQEPELEGDKRILPAGSYCIFLRTFINKKKSIVAKLLHSDGNQYFIRHFYNQVEDATLTEVRQATAMKVLSLLNEFLMKNKQQGKEIRDKVNDQSERLQIDGAMQMINSLEQALVTTADYFKIKEAYMRHKGGF